MRAAILLVCALVLPALWGALVHWWLWRLWPAERRQSGAAAAEPPAAPATDSWDYQI